MRLTRFAVLLLAVLALSALAAESKHDRDVRACEVEADAAVAAAKLKHPADVTKVKRDAFAACIAARTHPGSKPRAK